MLFEPADSAPPPDSEDVSPLPARLFLSTPEVRGSLISLIVEATPGSSTGSCLSVRDIGLPIFGSSMVQNLRFDTSEGGAQGGGLRVSELSPLGVCRQSLDLVPGSGGSAIAQSLWESFQSRPIITAKQDAGGCDARSNPHDLLLVDGMLLSAVASGFEVCVDDDGVGFLLGIKEIGNRHPIADAGPDRTFVGRGLVPVHLNGSASLDPDADKEDSDRGIVRFEWYSVAPDGSLVTIASGVAPQVNLPVGAHQIVLRVTDEGGLSSDDELDLVVEPPDCNDNGIDDLDEVIEGTSMDLDMDQIPDECQTGAARCIFSGVAEGGQVEVSIQGFQGICSVVVPTVPGQSPEDLVASIVAAFQLDACLADQGVEVSADGDNLRVEGLHVGAGSLVVGVTDPGIEHAPPPVPIPTLSNGLLAILALSLAMAAWLVSRSAG